MYLLLEDGRPGVFSFEGEGGLLLADRADRLRVTYLFSQQGQGHMPVFL